MSTFAQIKANILTNLNDSGNGNYSTQDVQDAVQDAYDEIISFTTYLIKKTTINFRSNTNYYFLNTIVNDYLATTAIFSNKTHLWLLDDKVLKDFDRERLDWENWTGDAIWWCPCNDIRLIALIPKLLIGSGNFDLYYYAKAPTVIDTNSPIIPPDYERLIEIYATADLLESYEEYSKAQEYWNEYWGIDDGQQHYESGIHALVKRSANIAQSDLLLLG